MELQFAFLADAATITNDGLFAVIGGGLDVIETQSMPAIKSTLVLVGRVVFKPSEFGKTHVVACEIHGPSGKIPQPPMALEIKPFKHPRDSRRPNWITVCFNYQGVRFLEPGDHYLRLSVKRKILGEVRVEVVSAQRGKT